MTPRFAPKHNVNVWLRKDFPGGFNAGVRAPLLWRAVRQQRQYTDAWTTTRSSRAPSAIRTSRWDWTVNADNLFNNDDYFLPGHFANTRFPGQPINVTTTVRLRWN